VFPYQSAPRFLIFDHDAKYGLEVPAAIRSMNITCLQTSVESPWQNGVAERWVGSCRRELLDDIIALNERHLRRLLSEYGLVLSRRPNASGAVQGDSWPKNSFGGGRWGDFSCAIGRFAPSLPSRGLKSAHSYGAHTSWDKCRTQGSLIISKWLPTQHVRPPTDPFWAGKMFLSCTLRGAF
jgi:hypothetical protein